MTALFSPLQLWLMTRERPLMTADCEECLVALQTLRQRHASGDLHRLTERRVEQSFNELLFARVFGYRTLLQHGAATYHLEPQTYLKDPATGAEYYDDFTLGFFAAGQPRRILATAEFKSPGADLDKLVKGKSAVDQAFERARARKTEHWVIVSNFETIRLYHASDATSYSEVDLINTLTAEDMRRAHVVLGRNTLLGDEATPSKPPLLSLKFGGGPTVLMHTQYEALLIQDANVAHGDSLASFHVIHDHIERLLFQNDKKSVEWLRDAPAGPRLEHDRLVVEVAHDDGKRPRFRLEVTREGTIRVQQLVPYKTGYQLQAHDIAMDVAAFLWLVKELGDGAFKVSAATFSWTLADLANIVLIGGPDWMEDGNQAHLRASANSAVMPDRHYQLDACTGAPAERPVEKVTRELLCPFTSQGPQQRPVRVKPSAGTVAKAIKTYA